MFVVAGVSGNTGSVVADALLSQKKAVRVVVRDAAKGAAWKARGAEVAVAELGDEASLTRALAGAEAAYLLVPPNMTTNTVLADQAKLIDAIAASVEKSGVGHVVFLSSIAAQHAAGTGPIRSIHYAEEKLGKSRNAVTFLRAAYFMENWGASLMGVAQGVLPTFLTADHAISMVATVDIGTEAAKALLEGGKGRTVIELAGPRDYSPKDVATALGSLVGRTITLQEGPESAVVSTFVGFGMKPDFAELFREMIHGVNDGTVSFEGGAARQARGKTPIEDVLKKLLAGAKATH